MSLLWHFHWHHLDFLIFHIFAYLDNLYLLQIPQAYHHLNPVQISPHPTRLWHSMLEDPTHSVWAPTALRNTATSDSLDPCGATLPTLLQVIAASHPTSYHCRHLLCSASHNDLRTKLFRNKRWKGTIFFIRKENKELEQLSDMCKDTKQVRAGQGTDLGQLTPGHSVPFPL